MKLLNEVQGVGARSLLMVLQSIPLSICVGILDNYGKSEKAVLITLIVMLPFVIWMLISMYKVSPYVFKHRDLVFLYITRIPPLTFIIYAAIFHTTSSHVSVGILLSCVILCAVIVIFTMASLKSDISAYYKKVSKIKKWR